ncbi:2435_t:CDS:2 [Scutellospora calospora]|uniref:2435_t:CDS:1 n=1 Tax=Scutellospora calospora TaxID=85575 RepID=A0ACA9L307_9GLOM|nr:2435_t:CDS:2 [Scutellospora calospora]
MVYDYLLTKSDFEKAKTNFKKAKTNFEKVQVEYIQTLQKCFIKACASNDYNKSFKFFQTIQNEGNNDIKGQVKNKLGMPATIWINSHQNKSDFGASEPTNILSNNDNLSEKSSQLINDKINEKEDGVISEEKLKCKSDYDSREQNKSKQKELSESSSDSDKYIKNLIRKRMNDIFSSNKDLKDLQRIFLQHFNFNEVSTPVLPILQDVED